MPWDNIPTEWVPGGGFVSLALAGFWFVLTGKLVPRQTLQDVRADRDARIEELKAERESWKEAFFTSEQARALTESQIDKLLETSRTTEALIRSLPRPGQRGS